MNTNIFYDKALDLSLGGKMRHLFDFTNTDGSVYTDWRGSLTATLTGTAAAKSYMTGLDGYANFTGGLDGENACLKLVAETGALFSPFSVFLMAEQRGMPEVDGSRGPVNKFQPLFSNKSGSVGIEIGLSNTNKLYVSSNSNGAQEVYGYSGPDHGENLWLVSYNQSNLRVERFFPRQNLFSGKSFNVGPYLRTPTSGDWLLGSGLSPAVSFYTGSDAQTYNGKIAFFSYFNTGLSKFESNALARALLQQTVTTGSDTSGNYSGLVATSVVGSAITGVTYYSISSALTTGTETGTYTYFNPLTGTVASGGVVYNPYDYTTGSQFTYNENVIYQAQYVSGTTTGITGFETLTGQLTATGVTTSYSLTLETGVLWSGFSKSYSTGAGGSYLKTTGTASFVFNDYYSGILPRNKTYLGPRLSLDYWEHQLPSLTTKTGVHDTFYTMKKTTPEFSLGVAYSAGRKTGIMLWDNGVLQSSGGFSYEFNPYKVGYGESGARFLITETGNIPLSDRDYYLYENRNHILRITGGGYVHTGSEIDLYNWYTGAGARANALGMMSYNRPNRHVDISYTGNTGVFTGVPSAYNSDVFFNGVKLVSGEDFVFNPSFDLLLTGQQGISGATGQLKFVEHLTINITGGTGYADYQYAGLFWPKTVYSYRNGIAQDHGLFIEHDIRKGLVSGVNHFPEGLKEVVRF